jgi:hypothetical protein
MATMRTLIKHFLAFVELHSLPIPKTQDEQGLADCNGFLGTPEAVVERTYMTVVRHAQNHASIPLAEDPYTATDMVMPDEEQRVDGGSTPVSLPIPNGSTEEE